MRRGQEHEQHHSGNGAAAGGRGRPAAGLPTAQWQAPQRPNGYEHYCRHYEADLDQVESAFFEGFAEASDPVSFLKLAGIPFEALDRAGQRLALLRVECGLGVDVGSLSPRAASEDMRYIPLPRRMVTRRRQVRFLYVARQRPAQPDAGRGAGAEAAVARGRFRLKRSARHSMLPLPTRTRAYPSSALNL